MRGILLGFALGAVWLQQQAALPGWGGGCFLVVLFGGAAALGFFLRRRGRSDRHASGKPRDVRATVWAAWAAFVCAAFVAGFGYAAVRAELRLSDALPASLEGRDLDITGFVRGLPARSADGTRFLFEIESAGVHAEHVPRVVQLSWFAARPAGGAGAVAGADVKLPPPALRAGERWTLNVRLQRPHGNANFGARDAEAALLERGIRATGRVSASLPARRLARDATGPRIVLDRLRAQVRDRVDTALGAAPHRGIVTALAVGAQDAVSDDDWRLMRNTGTSHLVAISGLHIGFVAGLAAAICGFVWRRLRWRGVPAALRISSQKASAVAAAGFGAFYAGLSGFNIPAQRSLWMLCFVALAVLAGRRPASSLVLAWAAALVLLADPWAVTAAGFWLSFCAVAAILLALAGHGRHARRAHEDALESDEEAYAEALDRAEGLPADVRRAAVARRFPRLAYCVRALGRRVTSAARVQYAITIGLAPLTVWFFSQIPLAGPLANAFAIPWVSALVTPCVLAGVLLPAPFDSEAYRLAHGLLALMCDALAPLAASPWTLWRLPRPDAFAMAAAACGVVWALAPRGWPLRFAAPLAWLPLLAPGGPGVAAGAFRLTALDVGQGGAVVVETARHTLLFDAGPGPESTRAGERIVVPYLFANGVASLDTLMISHSDSDHAGGGPAVLDSVRVGQLLASLTPREPLAALADQRGVARLRCVAGQRWQWDGVAFAVLWPPAAPLSGKPNAQSCVLKVTAAAGRSALLAADIEADVERALLRRDKTALRADVLVAPHHGSKTSSTEPFLDSVEPRVVLFQVGYRNRFHHPHPQVFARYRLRGIELSRSDEDGAARVDVGAGIVLERFRQTHARYWMPD